MHSEVQEVIDTFDLHRARFEQFALTLTDDQLNRDVPGSVWIVKDFISHLATIDEPVARMFGNVRSERRANWDPPTGDRFHIHRFNQAHVEERRRWSVEEILAGAEAVRARLKDELSQMGQEDLDLVINLDRRGSADLRFGDYLKGLSRHDPMHAADMMRAMPEREDDEIRAWFDDPVIQGYRKQMNV